MWTHTEKKQYSTAQCSAVQCSTMQCDAMRCDAILYNTIQYSTVQYSTVQYSTIQYNTIQYNTMQYNTVQYNTNVCVHVFIGCTTRWTTSIWPSVPKSEICFSTYPGPSLCLSRVNSILCVCLTVIGRVRWLGCLFWCSDTVGWVTERACVHLVPAISKG